MSFWKEVLLLTCMFLVVVGLAIVLYFLIETLYTHSKSIGILAMAVIICFLIALAITLASHEL